MGRARAEKSLPTDRLGFDKQVAALQAIAQLSGTSKRPVSAEAISAELGLKGNTGGLSNKFFLDNGWIEFAGRGAYVASDALIDFARHLGMDREDLKGAKKHLVRTAEKSWHWQEIADRVEGQGLRTNSVLQFLATAAGAGPDHRQQLDLVIDWLAWLGLVQRTDDKVIGVAATESAEPDEATPAANEESDDVSGDNVTDTPEETVDTTEVGVGRPAEQAKPAATPQAPEEPADAALVSMNFSVRITADDAVKLSDGQLRALLEFAEKMQGK